MYRFQVTCFACNILSSSCLKASFKSTGTGFTGVCLGGIFGSSWIWYGGPGKHPTPSNTSASLYVDGACRSCTYQECALDDQCILQVRYHWEPIVLPRDH